MLGSFFMLINQARVKTKRLLLMKFKQILCVLLMALLPHVYANKRHLQPHHDNYNSANKTVVPVTSGSKDAIGSMLLQSISLMGIPYRWGGNTPEEGMDCSGFIRYVFKKSLGINLPRTAAEMSKIGKRVGLNDLEPGDLLFFNTGRGSNTHIGMYIGDNKFIQAPRTGQDIQITQFDGYYRSHFNGAKRVVQENEDDDGNTTVVDYQDVRQYLPSNSKGRHAKRHGRGGSTSKVHAKKNKSVSKRIAKSKSKS